MKKYKNLNGNSNVAYYQIYEDSIDVIFKTGDFIYNYNVNDIGQNVFNELKRAAINGYGLNSLIMRLCRKKYTKRLINR